MFETPPCRVNSDCPLETVSQGTLYAVNGCKGFYLMEAVFIPPIFVAALIGGLTYILGRVSPVS